MSNEEIQQQRFLFLKTLYNRRNWHSLGIPVLEVGKDLGFDISLAKVIAGDLENEMLVKYAGATTKISITVYGIDKVKQLERDSDFVKASWSNRLSVLRRYYEIRDEYYGAGPEQIASDLQLDRGIVEDIVFYFMHKGYLKAHTFGPKVRITHEGIKFVELNGLCRKHPVGSVKAF